MFTNANQLTSSKMAELTYKIEEEKPLIIAVCEVKPKNARYHTLKDYEIPNYSLHPVNLENNTGRGIAVYSHCSIEKSTIQIEHKLNFEEICLLEVCLHGGDVLLFGCCHRSPTATETSGDNNIQLHRLLTHISRKTYTHKCIIGDFNYRNINWSSWTTSHSVDSTEAKFIEAVRDSYLYQHVEHPTRRRGNDDPSRLDLLFTEEAMQITKLLHHSPLCKSDHNVLTFEFQCYVTYSKPKDKFIFAKGDYDAMRISLINSNWKDEYSELEKDKPETAEVIWCSLKSKLIELRNQFVPLEKTSKEHSWKQNRSIPTDKATRESIRQKNIKRRSWMVARNRNDVDVARLQYTKARNKVKRLIRKAKISFEQEIAQQSKTNPKAFWSHTRRKLKTKSVVAPLLSNPQDKDSIKFDDAEKANILLQQFSSVFINESNGNIPRIENRTNSTILDLHVTNLMVLKQLMNLNVNKSCRPDEIHPRLLIELLEHIAGPVALLFNMTMKHGFLLTDWERALAPRFIKKDRITLQRTIGLLVLPQYYAK